MPSKPEPAQVDHTSFGFNAGCGTNDQILRTGIDRAIQQTV